MTKLPNPLLLTSGILMVLALFLAGPAQAQGTLQASETESVHDRYSAADEFGRAVYLVEFAEPGLMERFRQIRSHGERFDLQSPQMQSELANLQAQQQAHIRSLATSVGRSLDVTHYYLASHSGIATRLTHAEARAIGGLPGVVRVERERVYEIDTYRGPEFIGADSLWNGTGNPSGLNLLGENMVAAILDTGIVANHPSFANDAACGHGGGADDKLLSALDCASTDGAGMCNGPDPSDGHSHGSHVAGTVAGNFLDNSASPAPAVDISGVAPCARVRAYKVCDPGCPVAPIQAAMNSILMHGDVDVMNFSISGGRTPWTDNDRRKLDLVDEGIFVAASAGNTSTSIPDPVGQVGHLGPWVATVANSSHDGLLAHTVTVAGTLGPIAGLPGTGPALTTDFSGDIRWAGDVDAANIEGCTAFPAGSFTGEAALISRGTCGFVDKVNNAANAGAAYVIVYNNAAGAPIVMGALEPTSIASSMVSLDDGNAIIAELDGSPASVLVESDLTAYLVPVLGDILSAGSLIGPTPSPVQNLQKPDITGPGTSIYAAGTGPSGYTLMSGTSMSSPHLAGAAVLMRQAHPDWSPVEVKSAIMMTASKSGSKPANGGPWDADDVGSGRADLSVAAQAGLVMHETFANFLAANPATGGDVRTLNLAALRDMDCSPDCSFTRTVRNTLEDPTNWSVSVDGLTGAFTADVQPATFAFTGDTSETQTVTITFTPSGDQTGTISFGEVQFTEAAAQSPDLHYTVALRGAEEMPPEAEIGPESFSFLLEENGSSFSTLTIANVGEADLLYTIDQAEPAAVVLQPGGSLQGGQGEPIELVVDAGFPPGSLVGVGTQQFLWFNRFTPGALDIPFTLEEVQVAFLTASNASASAQVGDVFDIHVWAAPDGDPTGAVTLLASVTGQTITTMDALNSVTIPGGVNIDAATGDVLIGVVNRTSRDPHFPAAGDTGVPSQERSWIAFNFPGGVASDPPVFSEAGTLNTIDGLGLPRNFIIRGVGTGGSACLAPSDVSWLTVTPDAGTIAGGDSDEITVSVDMDGLGTGTFEASLCIETNDENLPVMVVPISVEVVTEIQLPVADVSPASFDFTVDFLSTDEDDLVIANNGDGGLMWDLFEPFNIPILPRGTNVHLDEDFSGTTFPPTGWSRFKLQGGGIHEWVRDTASFNSAPASARQRYGAVADGYLETYLVTPQMALGSNPQLTFAERNQFPTFYEFHGVYASTGSCDPSDGDFVLVEEVQGTNVWRSIDIDLNAFAGQDTCIAFGYEGLDAATWYVDDVLVTSEVPPIECYDPSESPWLSVSASSGTVDAGQPADVVTVTVDGNDLDPGTYEATLCVYTNDPGNSLVTVPVSMQVIASATFGTLEGTVSSLGYCSADPFAAAGATIEVTGDSGTVYTATADAAGFYQLLLDTDENPVSVTASAPDHTSATEAGVTLIAQDTVTVDFDLVLEAACATVEPGSLSVALLPDETAVESIEIGNLQGAADLVWTVFTEEVGSRAHFPEVPYFVAPGVTEGVSELADESGTRGGGSLSFEFPLGTALEAFSTTGFTADGYVSLDPLVPGALNLINAAQPTNVYAATFIDNDFSQQYMLTSGGGSLAANTFGVTDVTTGAFTSLGTVTGGSTATWSSMKWDHSTSTLYAANASRLYTIDLDTLVATDVGPITGPGVDPGAVIIAIAISPDGLMYAIDIIADVLLAVDKETAEASVIGPLGVNANFAQDMDFDNSDGTLYWAGYLGGGNSQMFTVDLATGAATAIGNIGGGNELLSFTIASEGGGATCQAPSAVSWLTVDPTGGTTEAGSTDTIDVLFDSTGLSNGVYEAFVCIETNDANNELIAVPVSLNVAVDELFQDRFEQ